MVAKTQSVLLSGRVEDVPGRQNAPPVRDDARVQQGHATKRSRALQLRFVTRPWGRVAVWRGGQGAPLVAVHGLGGSGRYWSGLSRLIGDRYEIIAPDLAGFASSGHPTGVRYDRAFHLDNLAAVIDDVTDGTVTLVGHSMGGLLAALLGARSPDRIAALALVAAPRPGTGPPPREEQWRERDERVLHRAVYRGFQLVWPVITLPVITRTYPRAVIVDFMRHSLSAYWETVGSVLWDPAAANELHGLRQLTDVPALVMTGTADRRVPAADADHWMERLPHADRIEVASDHQLLLRTRFAALASWLRTVEAQRSQA